MAERVSFVRAKTASTRNLVRVPVVCALARRSRWALGSSPS